MSLIMKLRAWSPDDILELDRLWQEHWSDFTLPGIHNKVIDAIAENEDRRIIGYGQVKLFAESMLFLDPTARKRDRSRAVRLLMQEAFRGAERAGITDVYAFIKDPDFALLIEKHFGFERVLSPGELLLKRL